MLLIFKYMFKIEENFKKLNNTKINRYLPGHKVIY